MVCRLLPLCPPVQPWTSPLLGSDSVVACGVSGCEVSGLEGKKQLQLPSHLAFRDSLRYYCPRTLLSAHTFSLHL